MTPPSGGKVDAREGNADDKDEGWDCRAPWQDIGNYKQPDLLVAVGSEQRWVIDAKYKDVEAPGAPDQYQLFAYSHLARINGAPPTHAAIAFPKRPDGKKHIKQTYARFASDQSNDASREFLLSLVHVPFPPQDAALSDDAWRNALGAMRTTWREVFFAPEQESETSATQPVALVQIE
jgi:hypothetical protein